MEGNLSRPWSLSTMLKRARARAEQKFLTFTVSLSGATTQTVTRQFCDGGRQRHEWFRTMLRKRGILTLNPGELTKSVNAPLTATPTVEPDETFFLNLSSPGNAVIGKAQGNGGILNDDGPVGSISFSQTGYNVNENTGFIAITVNRTGDLSATATVDYATSDTGAPASCATSASIALVALRLYYRAGHSPFRTR